VSPVGEVPVPPSPLLPASPSTAPIAGLFWVVTAIAALVFLGVEAGFLWAAYRYHQRRHPVPAQFTGNARLEIAWTILPALVMVLLFVLTVQTYTTLRPIFASEPASSLLITGEGRQWVWLFRYPDGRQLVNELRLPRGEAVVLRLRAPDVIHAFAVPQLVPKRDLIPGRVTEIRFTPTVAGVYYGMCAEFCGLAHAQMLLTVYVMEPADYQAWLQSAPSGR